MKRSQDKGISESPKDIQNKQQVMEQGPSLTSPWLASLEIRFPWFAFSVVILIVSLLLQVYLTANLKGFVIDQHTMIRWMNTIHRVGLKGTYDPQFGINYPPVWIYILEVFVKIQRIFHFSIYTGGFLFRLPIILATIFFMAILLLCVRKFSFRQRLIFSLFIVFNPALIFVGPVWGQVDIIYVGFLGLSLFFLRDRPIVSAALLALALSAKMQTIILVPIYGVWVLIELFRGQRWINVVRFVGSFFVSLFIVWLPVIVKGELLQGIKMSYLIEVGRFPRVSVSAMNIWFYVLGVPPNTPDDQKILPFLSYKDFGLLLIAILCLYIVISVLIHSKVWDTEIGFKAASLVALGFFLLATQVHERYIIPAVLLFICSSLFDSKWWKFSFAITLTAFFNMLADCYTGKVAVQDLWMVYLNIGVFVYALIAFHKRIYRLQVFKKAC